MRWDEQRVERDLRLPGVGDGTVVRTFDAPEAMGINFHEVRARSALNRVPGSRYGFGYTNPYQWVESRYRLMPEILAALEAADTPVSVLTKSPLVMRDVEIFERMARRLPVSVNLSVPTLDEKAWRATEPHTPSPTARLNAVAELRRRGIDSGVLIAPLMPGINDTPEQVQPIIDRAKEAGATFLGGVALHLRDEVRDVFFAWLQAKRPDLIPRYEKLYSGGRAYLSASERNRVSSVVRGWGRRRSPPPTSGPSARSEYPSAEGTAVSPSQDALF